MRLMRWSLYTLVLAALVLLGGTATGSDPGGSFVGPASGSSIAASAPPPTADSNQYVAKTWTEKEGLPHNSVWALERSRRGGLWVGTLDGLAHFDGHRFKAFDAATTEGLAGNRIKSLLRASDGTLWIGTTTGLSTYRGGAFQAIAGPKTVQDLAEDGSGTVWMGTDTGELYHSGEAGPQQVPLPDTLDSSIMELATVGRDSVWFTTEGHLFLYHNGTVRHPYRLGRTEGTVSFVDSTPDGTLWVHAGSRLISMKNGRLRRYDHASRSYERVQRVLKHPSGTTWMATEKHGLLRRADSTVQRVNPGGSVPRHLRDLVRDESGQWWMGTYNEGLVRLRRPLFRQVARGPAAGRPIHGVYASGDGTLWVGTHSNGLLHVDESTPTQWTGDDGFYSGPVWSIAEDDAGTLWIGTNGGLFRKQRGGFEIVQTAEAGTFRTNALYRDAAGTLWISNDEHGLYRYRRGTLRRMLSGKRLSARVYALHRTKEGALWIGTRSQGVARYSRDSLRWYGPDDGLPYPTVRDVHETRDGTIWVATYGGGVARYDEGRFSPVTPEEGLPDGSIHVIHEAPRGTFWMTSNRGVFRVGRRQLEAVADGRRDRVYVRHFDTEHGMPSRECNGNFQPAIAEDEDGHLWIPTMEGLTSVDPSDPRLAVPDSLPVRVTEVRADGTTQSLDSLRLAPSTRRLALDFSGVTLRHGGALSFRYRLDGGDWTPARGRRTAEFTNLDAGGHRFEVQATLNGETWYTQSEALRFAVAPHFYETGWFRLLALLGLVGLGGAAYVWRTRALRRRQQKLQRMVEARTEQLVEEKKKTEAQAERLEALDRQKNRFFANISHELRTPLTILTGTAQDLLDGAFGELPAPARRQLEIMRSNIGRLRRLTDQLLDLSRLETADPELNDEPRDLALLLRQAVRSFVPLAERRGLDLRLDTTVDTHPCRVDPEKLEKIVGNLLSNALKNTPEGGEVRVTLGVEEGDPEEGDPPVTVLRVADTGRGIAPERQDEIFERFAHAGREDTDRSGTGIGLSLVREHTELHGGTIDVESAPGTGTVFTACLPLPPADPEAVEAEGDSPDSPAPMDPEGAPVLVSGDGAPDDDRPTLLVAEDNADVRAYLRRHLRETYHVVEASGGAEGLETARETDPDLLITDLMMPEMDGIELCRQIRSDDALAPVPVVLLTARAAEEDAVAGLEAGADAYVTKPFSIEELKARLRRLLDAHWTGTADAPSGDHPAPDVEVTSADEEFLTRVTDAIDEHLSHTDFTVEDLAAEVGLSPRQLHRKLKRLTGETPAAFVRNYRLDAAAQLLEAETCTVSEVAYEVGFGTPETFATRFEERFGCPPSTYPDEASSVPD